MPRRRRWLYVDAQCVTRDVAVHFDFLLWKPWGYSCMDFKKRDNHFFFKLLCHFYHFYYIGIWSIFRVFVEKSAALLMAKKITFFIPSEKCILFYIHCRIQFFNHPLNFTSSSFQKMLEFCYYFILEFQKNIIAIKVAFKIITSWGAPRCK